MPYRKPIKVLGADTTALEICIEFLINFTYGLVGNSIVVFGAKEMDTAIFINFMAYYLFLSIIINRTKYLTKFGKYLLFPISSSLGAYTGYKLALYCSTLF